MLIPRLQPQQQAAIWAATNRLPAEKRSTFIDRVTGRLRRQLDQCTHGNISNADIADAISAALGGLQQQPAAAAQ